MAAKDLEEQKQSEKDSEISQASTALLHQRASYFIIMILMLAFVLCVLLSVAPLSRIADPVIRLQIPTGALLARIGAWLPNDLGLSTNKLDSQLNSNMLEFLALILLEFLLYSICALFLRFQPASRENKRTLHFIWIGAVAAGSIYVLTPATLSHDIIAYASYSRLIVSYHANPYFVVLAAYPHDPFYAINYWSHAISVYGPVWMAVCAFWGLILGPSPVQYFLAFRLFALAAHLGNILLVTLILRNRGCAPGTVALGTLLYAWNPLVLFESSNGGHNDVFMVFLILLGILLSIRAEKRGFTQLRNYMPPVVAFSLAVLIKYTILPILVFFILALTFKALREGSSTALPSREGILRNWKHALFTILPASAISIVVALLFYGPFWVYHSLHDIYLSFVTTPAANYAEFSIFRAILEWNKLYSLPSGTMAQRMLHLFSIHQSWTNLNAVALLIMLLIGAVWLWYSQTTRTIVLATLLTLGVVLILTPWFYAWYVLWLVSLAVVCLPVLKDRIGRGLLAFALVFSATAFFTYLFLYGYPPIGKWIGFACLTTILPPLLAFLLFIIGRGSTNRKDTTAAHETEELKAGA